MLESSWQGSRQEKLRLYGKVREEHQQGVREKYERRKPHRGERGKRLWAANEALWFGPGGIRAVAEAVEISTPTILEGKRELRGEPSRPDSGVVGGGQGRRGGGRSSLQEKYPALLPVIEPIVDPAPRGDPMAPLKGTSKSLRPMVRELSREGYKISATSVSKLLQEELGYSLQGLPKTREGSSHPDRDGQFQYINRRGQEFQQGGQPVISVDSKKKELGGDFQNGGRAWHRKGEPEGVGVHDFEDPRGGQATPPGLYDLSRNQGWVRVGVDQDSAEFAVDSIRHGWKRLGQPAYPEAEELLLTAAAGGSHS